LLAPIYGRFTEGFDTAPTSRRPRRWLDEVVMREDVVLEALVAPVHGLG